MQKKIEAVKKKNKSEQDNMTLESFLNFLDPKLWSEWHEKCNFREYPFCNGFNTKLSVPSAVMQNEQLISLLVKIVRDDDWKRNNKNSIDMTTYTVPESYVMSYINKVNSLQDDIFRAHKDTLVLLVYFAVATRFYVEKSLKKMPMPSLKAPENEARKDFDRLKNTSGDRLSFGDNTGKKAANFFMEDTRLKCPGAGYSFEQYWNTPVFIGKTVTFMKKYKRISKATINKARNDFSVSPFRPAAVKYLVHFIHQRDSDVKISSYLNLCGGWGCRLVGALATPEITRYIQTDPNTDLLPVSKKIYEAYDPQKNTKVHFYDQPMEDLTVDQLCPDGKKNQLIFFSPPYFNKEKYPGEKQSHQRYISLETWCNDFLYKSLQVSYFALDNGILAINLANILLDNGDRAHLTDCLVHLLEVNMANYFTKFAEPEVYATQNCPGSFIYMYKTKPYRDSIGSYPDFVWQAEWKTLKKDRADYKPMTERTKTNSNETTTTKPLAIGHHNTSTISSQAHLLSHVNPVKPSIANTTLAKLHQCIEHFNTLNEVADYYGCFPSAVIKRISDWDIRLSYDKLKYKYASSGVRNIQFYTNWQLVGDVMYIDNQPLNPNCIYFSFINSNPLINPYGFMPVPGSNLRPMQVICINPFGTLVSHTICIPQPMQFDVNTVVNYLEVQGMIKTWIEIPHYNECIPSKRAGNEYLTLMLDETTAQLNTGLSSNSGFFTQGNKTKRESQEEDTSNKKPRFDSKF